MPTSGGLYKSLTGGKDIGCNVVQLFTCSPRQWSHPPLKQEDVAQFLDAQQETGIEFIVAHDSYLINLAAPSEEILLKSQAAFRSELDRANQLNIKWLVTHMGAHLGQGEEEALSRLAESLRRILEATDSAGHRVGIALETTAGQGTGLGWRFEQLGKILADVGEHPRLGVCLDTCHVFVAGYDLRDRDSYERTWAEFDRLIGYGKLKVIHANDAKKPLGSRVDRHEHIGSGEIGMEPFARLVTDNRLKHIPVVVETPDSDTMHAVNVARLQRLAAGQAPLKTISVQLFGHYSDISPDKPIDISVPYDATVLDLVEALGRQDPRLTDLASHCRFAVNEEYCELSSDVMDGASLAVMPPVSGG
jgi:deoxyribonuclease-4